MWGLSFESVDHEQENFVNWFKYGIESWAWKENAKKFEKKDAIQENQMKFQEKAVHG